MFFKKYKLNFFGWGVSLIILILLIAGSEYLQNKKTNNLEEELVPVVQVFDGDTFSVQIDGVTEKIRILGIDTPEVAGGHRDAECFGEEASAFTKKMLTGKSVALQVSSSGDTTDKYGRLLRYVMVDNNDFGKMLIEQGYAESYKKFPHDKKAEYTQVEKQAQQQKKGMWGKCK